MEEYEWIYFAQSNQLPQSYWWSWKYVWKLKDRIFGLNLLSDLANKEFLALLVSRGFVTD